jgi:hypothetical protein
MPRAANNFSTMRRPSGKRKYSHTPWPTSAMKLYDNGRASSVSSSPIGSAVACRGSGSIGVTDRDLGRKPTAGVARASGCRHPTRVCRRKREGRRVGGPRDTIHAAARPRVNSRANSTAAVA